MLAGIVVAWRALAAKLLQGRHKAAIPSSSLCNLCVLCVSVVPVLLEFIHHRDTEVAQRNLRTRTYMQSPRHTTPRAAKKMVLLDVYFLLLSTLMSIVLPGPMTVLGSAASLAPGWLS